MRTLLLIICCLSASYANTQSNPDLLVYEPFDYGVFNPLWCLGDTTQGWTGEWQRANGDDAIIRAGNLPYPGLDTDTGHRGAVEFVAKGIRYNRSIQLIEDDGQVLWVSVLMDFKPGANPNNVGNITLTKNGSQVFSFGRKYGNQRFGTIWPPNVTPYNTDIATEGLHWLVVRIQFSGDSGQERAWLWIDPAAETEPDTTTADLIMPQDGLPGLTINNGIDGVQLKAEGNAPLLLAYDEFRMGRTFKAINPKIITSTAPELSKDKLFQISPNPSRTDLRISWIQDGQKEAINILDVNGKIIYQKNIQFFQPGKYDTLIPLKNLNLSPGNYFVQLMGAQTMDQQTFIYLNE